MEKLLRFLVSCLLASLLGIPAVRAADDLNPDPPSTTVKLIFIHHSTGENWLVDGNGDLGIGLRDNNYFVSDTNYGWGPDSIGDTTDIGHWWNWFRGESSATYLSALYSESGQHSSYSRLATDPGGKNQIVMFKSCFPNSQLGGSPLDPPTTGNNPLRGQDAYSSYHTVGNAKGIYNDIQQYFASKQNTLFVVIAAPPLVSGETDSNHAANARAFNNWLYSDWLSQYPYHNVAVFDFYNVLTSNGGSTQKNDAGWETGNHHRWWASDIQHIQTVAKNTAAYGSSSSDSHPTPAGNQKATTEFVSFLNVAYHCWKGSGGCPSVAEEVEADFSADVTTGVAPLTVNFTDQSTGAISSRLWDFGDGESSTAQNPSHTYTAAGSYTVSLTVNGAEGSDTETKTDYITVQEETPWSAAYGVLFRKNADLELFRRFRDHYLMQTVEGKRFTALLYQNSRAALAVLLAHPELMQEAKQLIGANLGAVARVLRGQEGALVGSERILAFLDAFADKSPSSLANLLHEVTNAAREQQRRHGLFLGFRL